MGTQISQNDAPDWFQAKKQSEIKFRPTNTADEESDNEAFGKIEDIDRTILTPHSIEISHTGRKPKET